MRLTRPQFRELFVLFMPRPRHSHLSCSPHHPSAAPPQFATSHPVVGSVLPASPSLPPSFTLGPPISAYTGVRPPDQGNTNDRRVLSYQRHRNPSITRETNAPRTRTTMVPSPTPSTSVPAPLPVLQLRPVPPSSSSPGSGASSSAIEEATQLFAVTFFPFAVSTPILTFPPHRSNCLPVLPCLWYVVAPEL